ncbi:MAG TPA: hypothetical protein VMP67_06460 [Candidatus Limnocylindria bacterium]|nr:hypothetical protein [Candidatus Limnocylindria bacterium]
MEQRLNTTPPSHEEATAKLIESAESLGIEIDREEAERWIAAMSAESFGNITVDVNTGVYGHRVTMADHDPGELERFRRMASIVGFEDQPPVLMTALALSGSAAQGRIHRFPADADFFERVHIRADTREEACRILAEAIRAKSLATLRGDGYRLQEVKFGTWPAGGPGKGGQPVSWTPAQVEAGTMSFRREDGSPAELSWDEAALEPGWCKLDWVIADPVDKALANVSNVLDPTWEAPDGTITPLDGYLDPYFQEVYLETDSIPLFSRLVKEMGADSVADYVERLTEEVYKYTVKEPNHGKAARRMYNIFRLTGRYPEAAYIRELFDEPVTALYQVAALLRALDEAADAGDAFETDALVAQVDQLIMSAIAALEGRAESEMVRRLLRLRDAVSSRESQIDRTDDIVGVRDDAMRAVNEYFERVLKAIPSIQEYLDSVAATRASSLQSGGFGMED